MEGVVLVAEVLLEPARVLQPKILELVGRKDSAFWILLHLFLSINRAWYFVFHYVVCDGNDRNQVAKLGWDLVIKLHVTTEQ